MVFSSTVFGFIEQSSEGFQQNHTAHYRTFQKISTHGLTILEINKLSSNLSLCEWKILIWTDTGFFPQQISNNHCLEEVFVIYDYTLTEAPMWKYPYCCHVRFFSLSHTPSTLSLHHNSQSLTNIHASFHWISNTDSLTSFQQYKKCEAERFTLATDLN